MADEADAKTMLPKVVDAEGDRLLLRLLWDGDEILGPTFILRPWALAAFRALNPKPFPVDPKP